MFKKKLCKNNKAETKRYYKLKINRGWDAWLQIVSPSKIIASTYIVRF